MSKCLNRRGDKGRLIEDCREGGTLARHIGQICKRIVHLTRGFHDIRIGRGEDDHGNGRFAVNSGHEVRRLSRQLNLGNFAKFYGSVLARKGIRGKKWDLLKPIEGIDILPDRDVKSMVIARDCASGNRKAVIVQRILNRIGAHTRSCSLLHVERDSHALFWCPNQLGGGNPVDLLQLGNHGAADVLRGLECVVVARNSHHRKRDIGRTTRSHLRCSVIRERILDLRDRLLNL